MAHDVFISFTTRDKPVADAICHALESAGVRCWLATRDISPGSSWSGAIINAIGRSRVFVIIFSSDANRSPQVLREVERAVNKGIPIIPFRVEPVVPSEDFEYFLSAPHWLDALTPPLEDHLRKLTESVKTVLTTPIANTPPVNAGVNPAEQSTRPSTRTSAPDSAPTQAVHSPDARHAARRGSVLADESTRFTANVTSDETPQMPSAQSRLRRASQQDFRTRAAHTRATIARWGRPALAASILGLIAYVGLFRSTMPAPALAIAAGRDEALYAGKRYLAEIGAPSGRARIVLEEHDSIFRFLQRSPEHAKVQDAITAGLTWRWQVYRLDRSRKEGWSVGIGPQSRLVGFDRWRTADSASTANLTSEQARPIAESALRAHVPDATTLRFLRVSTNRLNRRTDHYFTWVRPNGAIQWRGEDSATQRVTVRVAGDEVRSYREQLVLPASYPRASRPAVIRIASSVVGSIAALFLLVLALVLSIRRSRIDDLQWTSAFRLSLAVLPVIFVGMLTMTVLLPGGPESPPWYAMPIFLAVMLLALSSAWLFCFVIAESLSQESRSSMVLGIHDLARGRLMTPEFVTAALGAYPIALCLLGFSAVSHFTSQLLFGTAIPPGLPDSMYSLFPTLGVVMQAGAALLLATGVWFCVSIAAYFRTPVGFALAFPALLVALFGVGFGAATINLIVESLIVLGLAITIWHAGAITALLAYYIVFGMQEVIAMLSTGSTDFVAAGLVGLALVAVPGVFAFLAHRRIAVSDPAPPLLQ